MSLLWASLVVVVFATLLERWGLPAQARRVGTDARAALATIRDPALDDGEKERVLRRKTVELFASGARIIAGGVTGLGIPLGGVWLLDLAGFASLSDVLITLQRPDFLIVVGLLGLVGFLGLRRMNRT